MRFSLSIYPSRNACLISYTTPSEASEGTFNDTARFSALFSLHHCLIFEESSSSEKSSNSPTITLFFKNRTSYPGNGTLLSATPAGTSAYAFGEA